MKKQYTIGEQSRRFLDALDVFQRFENVLLDALTATYGEDRGTEFFDESHEQRVAVEQVVMDYLRVSFSMQMGTDAERVEL